MNLTEGDVAPCQVGAEATATRPGCVRTRHRAAIATTPLKKKGSEGLTCQTLTTTLEIFTGGGREVKGFSVDDALMGEFDTAEVRRGGGHGGAHPLRPVRCPAIAILQWANDTCLRELMPGDPSVSGPCFHQKVTPIADCVAGLFMTPDGRKTDVTVKLLEHLSNLPNPESQPSAERS